MDFSIIFHADLDYRGQSDEEAVLLGKVDFLLNGVSFFSNYHLAEQSEEMGNTALSKEGFAVPVLPFISNLLLNFSLIGTKTLEIGKGMMDKELVIIPQGEHVLIGIKHGSLDPIYWYDGEQVTKSTNLPVNSMNIVPTVAFRQGIKKGILSFLRDIKNHNMDDEKLLSFIQKAELLQPS